MVAVAGLVFALAPVARHAGAATIADYAFAGGSGASADAEPNSTAGAFTKNPATADWGISSVSGTAFARSNATTASEAAAIAAGDYFRFTVTPNAGSELDLTQLTFDTTHDLTHPTPPSPDTGATMSFFVRSGADGFATNIGPTFTQAWNTTTPRTVDVSGTAYQNIQVPTEFRMYIHDSGVDLEENGARLDNVILEGKVLPAGTTTFQEGVSPAPAYTHDATYIRSNSVTTNYNSADQIIVGTTASGSPDVLRSLLEFDVSAIPASDQIDAVSLVLTTYSTGGLDQGGTSGNPTFNAHAYGFDIDETTATWNAPDAGASDAPGGTLGTLLTSASFDVTATGQAITFGDTAAFRTAVANALAGDGFLRLIVAKNDESTVGTHEFARFAADSFATAGDRPELLVTHSTIDREIPEPATLAMLSLAAWGLGGYVRRRRKA